MINNINTVRDTKKECFEGLSEMDKFVLRELINRVSLSKWQSFKTLINGDNIPPELNKKIIDIQKKIDEKVNARDKSIINAFFIIVYGLEGFKEMIGNEILVPEPMDIQAIKDSIKDYNLCQCWSRVINNLNIEHLPMDANQIRDYMSHKDNQQTLALIKDLDLSQLELTDVPPEIIHFSGLTTLKLNNNNLTQLPDLFGNLGKLQVLDLNNNNLTHLPDSFGNLRKLQLLNLNNNNLTHLPYSFGNLVKLERLGLKRNRLKHLPISFGNLVKLKSLLLEYNQLIFLPDSIGDCVELKYLKLSNNQLTFLPDSFGNLVELNRLEIQNNKLINLPASMINIGRNKYSFEKNKPIPITNVFIEGNIILLIPKCVSDAFNFNNRDIGEFFKNLGDSTDSLESVCRMVRKESDKILNNTFTEKQELGERVDRLDLSDKTQLYHRMWEVGSNTNEGDFFDWGERNRFNDMRLFAFVLGEFLYQKQLDLNNIRSWSPGS